MIGIAGDPMADVAHIKRFAGALSASAAADTPTFETFCGYWCKHQ